MILRMIKLNKRKCKCGKISLIYHAYCRECHNKSQREWRSLTSLSKEQRKKMNCRSYLHVYVKRGKIFKSKCEICGNKDVEAHHENYDKPLHVNWLCRKCHLNLHKKI